jgi:hypothetical protein
MIRIKNNSRLFVLLLIAGFLGGSFSDNKCYPLDDCCNNNCGRIDGKVIDPKTNNNVNIPFNIWIGRYSSETGLFIGKNTMCLRKTNNEGIFSFKIDAGIYYLQFHPDMEFIRNHNLQINYAFDPDVWMDNSRAQKVEVKKGQIVNIIKKAKLGGTLKIMLVDKIGNKVNLKSIFNSDAEASFKIVSPIKSNVIFANYPGGSIKILEEGEETIQGLLPNIYNLKLVFDYIGYGAQNVDNIKIEPEKVTEVKVLIDKNDNTGIEGYLTDKNGNPLEGFEVSVWSYSGKRREARILTNNNGYYKIIGLEEKLYKLNVYKLIGNDESYSTMEEIKANSIEKEFLGILIKMGVIFKKNILIESNLLN